MHTQQGLYIYIYYLARSYLSQIFDTKLRHIIEFTRAYFSATHLLCQRKSVRGDAVLVFQYERTASSLVSVTVPPDAKSSHEAILFVPCTVNLYVGSKSVSLFCFVVFM